MDRERRAGRGEIGERLALGHRRGAARRARQHQRLREARQSQFAPERRGGGGESGHAGRDRVRHPCPLQAPQLLAHGAKDREVARMEPRHVLGPRGRLDTERNDRVEIERRGVDDPRVRRAMIEQGARDQRAGIETDGSARDEIAPAHCDEIGSARPGADEVHGHLFRVRATRNSPCMAAPEIERWRRSRHRRRAAAQAAARLRRRPRAPRPRRYWARRTAPAQALTA